MPRHALFQHRLRPRIGGRGGEIDFEDVPSFRVSMLRRIGRRFVHGGGPKTRRGTRGVADVRRPPLMTRRCVIKTHYTRMSKASARLAALHLGYIERDGVERDGSKGQLYGDAELFDRALLAEPVPGERRQFRFIVSPEDAAELDLATFTRQLMSKMEADLGRKLVWGAVNHHDTDNPHVHIILRGLDAQGRDVVIDREYIKSGLRWRAQEIATRELGPRSEMDVADQRAREVTYDRFTSIDREIEPLVDADGRLDVPNLATSVGTPLPIFMARLETLERLRLAQRVSSQTWELAEGWTDVLKDLGQRNDIIKRIHRAIGAAPRPVVVDPKHEFPSFEGVLRRRGLHDEETGDLFAIVETVAGTAHYIRLPSGTTCDELHEGTLVHVSSNVERWVRPADRALEQLAARNGGIYDPAAQRAALEKRSQGADQVSPAELVAANVRRLSRLERYRLVSRLPDGRWVVPSDLVSQLEAREQSHPRRRLQIDQLGPPIREQVQYPGPTWLDAQPVPAPNTQRRGRFDRELATAIGQRAKFLRRIGIDPGAPDRHTALLERERATLAALLAAEHSLVPCPTQPDRFVGKVFGCQAPSGRPYLRVVDATTRTLLVVPAPPDSKRLEGRQIVVTRDGLGLPFVQAQTRARGDST